MVIHDTILLGFYILKYLHLKKIPSLQNTSFFLPMFSLLSSNSLLNIIPTGHMILAPEAPEEHIPKWLLLTRMEGSKNSRAHFCRFAVSKAVFQLIPFTSKNEDPVYMRTSTKILSIYDEFPSTARKQLNHFVCFLFLI
jgi:hypothetical protein